MRRSRNSERSSLAGKCELQKRYRRSSVRQRSLHMEGPQVSSMRCAVIPTRMKGVADEKRV